jgi:hypothetical protein
MKSLIIEEAYREIRINDGDRQVKISMAHAILRSLAVAAAKGQPRAQRLFTELLVAAERSNKALHDEWLETAIDFKVEWEKEFRRCDQLGLPRPAPIPHPDDIVINMKTGGVLIKGPMTREEKVKWDRVRERKKECDKAIAAYLQDLANEPDEGIRRVIQDEIDFEQRIRAQLSTVIPD